jgi:hypothetical protein
MDLKPTTEEAAARLRIDDALLVDLSRAIDQAHQEVLAYIDRPLHTDAAALAAAIAAAQAQLDAATTDAAVAAATAALDRQKTGIVVTQNIHAATMLLADRLMGDNEGTEAARKETAAHHMLQLHRRMGF